MPLQKGVKRKYNNLPKKGSAIKSAQDIKYDTTKKTEGGTKAKKDQTVKNRVAHNQINASEKSAYKPKNTSVGKATPTRQKQTKENLKKVGSKAKNKAKKVGLLHTNPNANAFETMHKSMYGGSIQTGNERRRAFTNKELRNVQQDAFANTAGGRFLANTAESLIDNSLVAVPYTLATGKKLSQSNFLKGQPDSEKTAKERERDSARREKMHSGVAAGAGRMAGMAVNYAMARSALDPQLTKAANAVMNGTRVGEMIKGSSTLGRIGQSVGTKTAQDIATGLVKESISDATLGFGQNALLNYGEGLRGSDFWQQQMADTALDFLVGGAMEGVGIGSQIRDVRRQAKNLLNESPTSMLSPEINKDDYLRDLWERMNQRMRMSKDTDNAQGLRNAAYGKIDDLIEEYNKVVDMNDKQFARYRAGKPLDVEKYVGTRRSPTGNRKFKGSVEAKKSSEANPNVRAKEAPPERPAQEVAENINPNDEVEMYRALYDKLQKEGVIYRQDLRRAQDKMEAVRRAEESKKPSTSKGLSDSDYYSFESGAKNDEIDVDSVLEKIYEEEGLTRNANNAIDNIDTESILRDLHEGNLSRTRQPQGTQRTASQSVGERVEQKPFTFNENSIRDNIENQLKDKATRKEKEELYRLAIDAQKNGNWGEYDRLFKEINSRANKTPKATEQVRSGFAEGGGNRVNAGDTKEIDVANLKNVYPEATDEEIESLYRMRNEGDKEGYDKLANIAKERADLKRIKDTHSDATEDEVKLLDKYLKDGDEEKYTALSNQIKERGEKNTKKAIRNNQNKKSAKFEEANTEREALMQKELNAYKRARNKENKQAHLEEYNRLKDMSEADYLVEKYNLNSGIDESTTRALATADGKEGYVKYLDYRLSNTDLSDYRRGLFENEKRRVLADSEENFAKYQTGEYTPPYVDEVAKEKKFVDTPSDVGKTSQKASQGRARLAKKGKNYKRITKRQQLINEQLEKAQNAKTPATRQAALDKIEEFKKMSPEEINNYVTEKARKAVTDKHIGSGELSYSTRKKLGIKGEWKVKQLKDLKSFSGKVNRLTTDGMTYVREIVDDYMSNGLLKKVNDHYVDEKAKVRFTMSTLKKITGYDENRLSYIIAKYGKGSPEDFSPKQISEMLGMSEKELNKKLNQFKIRVKSVEPDRLTTKMLADIIGTSEDNMRFLIKWSDDLSINDYGNVIRNASKHNANGNGFKDGFDKALADFKAKKRADAEAGERTMQAIMDNPEGWREAYNVGKPSSGANPTSEIIPEASAPVEAKRYGLDEYTRKELRQILRTENISHAPNISSPDAKALLKKNGITDHYLEPSGKASKALPRGKKVEVQEKPVKNTSNAEGKPLDTRLEQALKKEGIIEKAEFDKLNKKQKFKYARAKGFSVPNSSDGDAIWDIIQAGHPTKATKTYEEALEIIKGRADSAKRKYYAETGVPVGAISKEMGKSNKEVVEELIQKGIIKDEADLPRLADGTINKTALANNYRVKIPATDEEIGVKTYIDPSLKNSESVTQAVETKPEVKTETTSQTVEVKTAEAPKTVTAEDVDKMMRDELEPLAERVGVDPEGKTQQMLRKEIKKKLEAQETTTVTADEGSATSTFTSTSGIDDNFEGGTYTVNAGKGELPKKKTIKRLQRKASQETAEKTGKGLPKGEKVNGAKKKKPITSRSSYQEVEEALGVEGSSNKFRDFEEQFSKWKGNDTSKSLETYLKSEEIDPEVKKIMLEMRENNEAFTKQFVKNKTVLQEAEAKVAEDFDGTVAAFMNKAKSGEQFTSQDMADGYKLAKEYMARGDFRKAAEINGELSAALSETGRFLQSQRMWRSLTPEGKVSSALASIRKLEKSRGMARGTIKIGEEGEKLLKAIYDAKNNKDLAKANEAFATFVWNQVPRTFAEKANAWRYLAMLGNPKTHIRNILGNALFVPARAVSDGIATGMEKVLAKKIKSMDGGVQGHHAIVNRFNKEDRELLKKAGESFKDERAMLEAMNTKFFERQRPIGSSTFNTKILDFFDKFNSKALDKEDVAFMSFNYKSAYAQYCKSNGIKASDITEEIAKKASDYAQEQALKATYRDANRLAEAFNKMRRSLTPTAKDTGVMKVGKMAGGFLMDSTIPFVKTPLNILKRGTLEYSPIGLARGLGRIASAKDADSLLKGIEFTANGLTGTGVLALGLFLGNRGVVNGSMGDWNKKVAFDSMIGQQDYAVTVGDTSITLDWVAPMSMPFFVGVEASSGIKGGDVFEFIDALSNITDPVFEMSMLQGIENTFNTAFSDEKGLSTIAKNAGFNYLSQFVPTLFGQAARTRVEDRKTVVSTATNPLQRELEKQLGKILNKVPVAGDVLNQDYVDLWGRTDSKENGGDYFRSAIENFLSPAYISTNKETDVDRELRRLYEELGEEDKDKILPSVSSNAFKQKFNDEEFNMTASEFTQYKKTVGQAKYNGLQELFKTTQYKNASADEKRKMIERVYDDANNAGRKEYLTKASKEFASAPDFYMLDETKRERYDDSLDIGKQEWAVAYNAMTEAYNEVKDRSGETLTTSEKAFVLAKNGIKTVEQAQTYNKNISESMWERALNASKSGKTLEQMQAEAEARKNMTEDEKKFDSYFRQRAEGRYDGKSVASDVYSRFLKEVQYVDQNNPTKKKRNGSIDQSEAYTAINNIKGLTNAEKAYLWALAENDGGWKRKPFG